MRPMPLVSAAVLLSATSAFGAPTAAELSATWRHFLAHGAEHQMGTAPVLSAEELREIAAGEVIKQRIKDEAGQIDRLVAVAYLDQPVEMVWLALLDDKHSEIDRDLRVYRLPGSKPGHKILYQRLVLPFPITDRHWLIHIVNNRKLYEAYDGRAWQRVWHLDRRGEQALEKLPDDWRADLDGAIWTPVNAGTWLMLRAGHGTLAVYQLQTNIGGWVPEGLTVTLVKSKLDDMLEHMEFLATRIPKHYRDEHERINRPDGASLPVY